MSGPRYARRDATRQPAADRQARVRGAAEVMRRFGALTWYGAYTGLYWAMVNGRLIEAETPEALGKEIMSARGRRAR
ncbi:hypothetical protein E1287_42830 [Actinomadura sp. KC06]|uniref:hypothetical protein n=1 Tax=Actinomadura sp. KC06 TaxID=2530369 RepID=UPI001049E6EF|nr:hypothetical protein [Actinomadura sp. KC06]TDD14324.1 hypothetical protein E1287_42830 [Actinomadura sp. KC06]